MALPWMESGVLGAGGEESMAPVFVERGEEISWAGKRRDMKGGEGRERERQVEGGGGENLRIARSRILRGF